MRVRFVKNYKEYKIGDFEEFDSKNKELEFLKETGTVVEDKEIATKKEIKLEEFEEKIKKLELENEVLEEENKGLDEENKELGKEIKKLKEELEKLKNKKPKE